MFARTNVSLVNGNNTFTAVAQDSYGRQDTNAVTVNLPSTVSYTYDLNGNGSVLTYDTFLLPHCGLVSKVRTDPFPP